MAYRGDYGVHRVTAMFQGSALLPFVLAGVAAVATSRPGLLNGQMDRGLASPLDFRAHFGRLLDLDGTLDRFAGFQGKIFLYAQ